MSSSKPVIRAAQQTPIEGCLADAFTLKDSVALQRLLEDNPGLSQKCLSYTQGREEARLFPLPHLAIALNWLPALDHLATAKADFQVTEQQSGLTALEYAVVKCRLRAVDRLLGLGVPCSARALGLIPAYIPAPPSEDTSTPAPANLMLEHFLKAGADPWAEAIYAAERFTLPEVCLTWGRPELATYLIKKKPPPQSLTEDAQARERFHQRWWEQLNKAHRNVQAQLFAVLADTPLRMDLNELIDFLPRSRRDENIYGPLRDQDQYSVLLDMVGLHLIRFRQDRIDEERLEIVDRLGEKELHALLMERRLDHGTSPAPRVRPLGARL